MRASREVNSSELSLKPRHLALLGISVNENENQPRSELIRRDPLGKHRADEHAPGMDLAWGTSSLGVDFFKKSWII